MSGADRPNLRALADYAGILPEYNDTLTGQPRYTSDLAYEAVLSAMGYDASTDRAASQTLQTLRRARDVQILPPTRVISARRPARHTMLAQLAPELVQAGHALEWHLTLHTEGGGTHTAQGRVTDPTASPVRVPLPHSLEFGYHRILLELRGATADLSAEQTLIVTPHRCHTVRQTLGGRRASGICTNLYTVRSGTNWGIGDLTDLATLCNWCGRAGLDFVGINPLHALRNHGWDVSPYSPISRLYYNPIYIDPSAVPELSDSPSAATLITEAERSSALHELRSSDTVDYDRVMEGKRRILRELYRTFVKRHLGRDTDRGRAFAHFLDAEGSQLERFACYQTLTRVMLDKAHPADWHAWPPEYRDPHSPAVGEFCHRYRNELDYHKYLQFELDRQLGVTAHTAANHGLTIGLYQDLALGSSRDGSDAWSHPQLFVDRANLGAPPDDYSRTGQDWGFPPLHPHRLRETAYHYWRGVVRRALAHSGALRIDHAMGLLRQYWVPHGISAVHGAYVRFPADDLLGILALESRRHKAIVIGEDLGTVPPGFSRLLAKWGILSCRVLYFQRDGQGDFLPPTHYPRRALATVNTHDHPPLASFWSGDDLRLRRRVGDIPSDQDLDAARAHREGERRALLARLITEKLLPEDTTPPYAELCQAVHAFLARTPSRLIGVMLDDLSAERIPINLPGVGMDRSTSWSRRMTRTLEEITKDPSVMGIIKRMNEAKEVGPWARS